jgi:hypothetical protein
MGVRINNKMEVVDRKTLLISENSFLAYNSLNFIPETDENWFVIRVVGIDDNCCAKFREVIIPVLKPLRKYNGAYELRDVVMFPACAKAIFFHIRLSICSRFNRNCQCSFFFIRITRIIKLIT